MNTDNWNTYMLDNPTSHTEFLPNIPHNKPCCTLLLDLGCNIFYSQLQLLFPLVRWKVTVVLLVIPIWREVVLSKTTTINHKFIRNHQHSYCGIYRGAHIEKFKIFWRQVFSVACFISHSCVFAYIFKSIAQNYKRKHNSQFLNFTQWPVPPTPVLCDVHKFWGEKKLGRNDHIGFLKRKSSERPNYTNYFYGIQSAYVKTNMDHTNIIHKTWVHMHTILLKMILYHAI